MVSPEKAGCEQVRGQLNEKRDPAWRTRDGGKRGGGKPIIQEHDRRSFTPVALQDTGEKACYLERKKKGL